MDVFLVHRGWQRIVSRICSIICFLFHGESFGFAGPEEWSEQNLFALLRPTESGCHQCTHSFPGLVLGASTQTAMPCLNLQAISPTGNLFGPLAVAPTIALKLNCRRWDRYRTLRLTSIDFSQKEMFWRFGCLYTLVHLYTYYLQPSNPGEVVVQPSLVLHDT